MWVEEMGLDGGMEIGYGDEDGAMQDGSVPQCSVLSTLSLLHRLLHSDGVLWPSPMA